MSIRGRVIRYGDNVDTDVIIPARYLNTSDPAELAAHCMEDLDKTFVGRVRPGDIMVAGSNFGCGSSREHAPIALKASGIACVVAFSFARIFYRNAVNIGLPIIACECAAADGDELEIDFESGRLTNHTTGETVDFPPFPAFLQNIVEAGGLLKSLGGAPCDTK